MAFKVLSHLQKKYLRRPFFFFFDKVIEEVLNDNALKEKKKPTFFFLYFQKIDSFKKNEGNRKGNCKYGSTDDFFRSFWYLGSIMSL